MNTESTYKTIPLLNALQSVFDMIDGDTLGTTSDERLLEAMESFYRVMAFVDLLPKEVQIAVLDSPEYLVDVQRHMTDWLEGIELNCEWSKDLLA